MTNNFDKIKQILDFQSEDDFYHLQIIKRKKENPEIGSNSYVIKTYYIQSIEYLEDKMTEIINLCDFNNARAYINLNVRSFERMAFHTMKKLTDIIMNKDFKSARKVYESVCGEFGTGRDKTWIIDIDFDDVILDENSYKIKEIEDFIRKLQSETTHRQIVEKLRTRNGIHLIVSPFNISEFSKVYPQIDIHKNNPTILYTP
jgi:hypothetical protein